MILLKTFNILTKIKHTINLILFNKRRTLGASTGMFRSKTNVDGKEKTPRRRFPNKIDNSFCKLRNLNDVRLHLSLLRYSKYTEYFQSPPAQNFLSKIYLIDVFERQRAKYLVSHTSNKWRLSQI